MRVSAFIEPCLPSRAERPPSGPGWVHEIKHDGFRLMVRRDSAGIRRDNAVFLYAFDLLELDGVDLRRNPIEVRKEALANLLHSKSEVGLQLNEHFHEAGDVIFRHACKLGLEGIVSKRKGSPYRSGRSPDWLKMKNPGAPAVRRGIGLSGHDQGSQASPLKWG
jgi:bifunctional non-homologous end joining protein LigD